MRLTAFSKKLYFFPVVLFIFTLVNSGCKEQTKSKRKAELKELPANMEYSFDCLNSNTTAGKIGSFFEKADEAINGAATTGIEVSDEEVTKVGTEFYSALKKDTSVVIDTKDPLNTKINIILQNLLKARINPSGINYEIFLLKDDETINAYTAGGKIFVTTAIIKACKSDDQLYSIIGHEIGHNEKGHIKAFIQQQKAADKYLGEWSETIFGIKKLLTMSFNQKKELEADYYGIDLSWRLGYNVCSIKNFWDSLSVNEEHNFLEDMFRTHPYSDLRSKCLKQHIEKNFKQTCN